MSIIEGISEEGAKNNISMKISSILVAINTDIPIVTRPRISDIIGSHEMTCRPVIYSIFNTHCHISCRYSSG